MLGCTAADRAIVESPEHGDQRRRRDIADLSLAMRRGACALHGHAMTPGLGHGCSKPLPGQDLQEKQ
jgi:hypothetical protein